MLTKTKLPKHTRASKTNKKKSKVICCCCFYLLCGKTSSQMVTFAFLIADRRSERMKIFSGSSRSLKTSAHRLVYLMGTNATHFFILTLINITFP